ncbi:hypothetical protein GTA08_BOTSDO04884 [Botryosphaeria dothidea]|uniref:Uncharacterized protein n=1 Tax=Botryosphaeria dothidea TaxID=55169 RepID=A0A8H4N162_9PEZI|nr:hypothetical protein GTA08_BOTSDO04884 [Botryosphaeria dothidea]
MASEYAAWVVPAQSNGDAADWDHAKRVSVAKPPPPGGRLAIIEATRFWVREDAIDEQRRHIDLQTLRPVGQLGDFAYTRVVDTFDLPNTTWQLARLAPDPVLDKLAPAGR